MSYKRNSYRILVEKREGRDYLEDLDVDEHMLLKMIYTAYVCCNL